MVALSNSRREKRQQLHSSQWCGDLCNLMMVDSGSFSWEHAAMLFSCSFVTDSAVTEPSYRPWGVDRCICNPCEHNKWREQIHPHDTETLEKDGRIAMESWGADTTTNKEALQQAVTAILEPCNRLLIEDYNLHSYMWSEKKRFLRMIISIYAIQAGATVQACSNAQEIQATRGAVDGPIMIVV